MNRDVNINFKQSSHLGWLVWSVHYLHPLALHLLQVLVITDLVHDAPDLITVIYFNENHNIAIAMSSSCADPMLGLNILQGWLEEFKYLNQCHCPSLHCNYHRIGWLCCVKNGCMDRKDIFCHYLLLNNIQIHTQYPPIIVKDTWVFIFYIQIPKF